MVISASSLHSPSPIFDENSNNTTSKTFQPFPLPKHPRIHLSKYFERMFRLFVLALFLVEINILMGTEDCDYCSTVSGCLAECADVDTSTWQVNWNACKSSCQSADCAIYTSQRCYCASQCNGDAVPLLVQFHLFILS